MMKAAVTRDPSLPQAPPPLSLSPTNISLPPQLPHTSLPRSVLARGGPVPIRLSQGGSRYLKKAAVAKALKSASTTMPETRTSHRFTGNPYQPSIQSEPAIYSPGTRTSHLFTKNLSLSYLKKAAVAKALKRASTTMPVVKCMRQRYESMMACPPIVSSDTCRMDGGYEPHAA